MDLAVVRHEAIRVSEPPAGKGIGAEALVDEAERRDAGRIAQIVVEAADLGCKQQALVNAGPAGKAGNIEFGKDRPIEFLLKLPKGVLDLLANHDQLTLEGR